jgi:predicted dehydrogenase
MSITLDRPAGRAIPEAKRVRPKLGFLGVGWIGRNRLEAVARSGLAEIAAIADPANEIASKASQLAPGASLMSSADALFESDLDGVVIATPSALHAEQAEAALRQGKAVFCQKPLGRNAAETRRVVQVAREVDLLLGVDLSYRFMRGVRRLHELCRSGELGEIYAADLVFHNAYGPDKPWFYDRGLSGGGCVIDLGIHLVDLALWNLGSPRVASITSRLFAHGRPLARDSMAVEDYAEARLDLESGATIRLVCSWKLAAGCDAVISGSFYGTKGGAAFSNVNGSFYEFKAERYLGTRRVLLAEGPEEWGGLAIEDWVKRLGKSSGFDAEIEHLEEVSETLDKIYSNSLA